jgi:type IV pilus assembly protein PilW
MKLFAMHRRAAARLHLQRGLSIVELMVALVVALLVALAAANSAQFFSSQQRQGVGTGNAGTGATNALASIEEDLGHAGLGFFGDRRFLCSSLRMSVNAVDHSIANFSPLTVVRTGQTDQIDIVYSEQVAGGATVELSVSSTGDEAALSTFLPVAVGQTVLLAPPVVGDPCTLRSVSALDTHTPIGATSDRQLLRFENTAVHNQIAFAPPVTYAARAPVTVMGAIAWNRYRLLDGNLLFEQPLAGTQGVLASNVVGLRVQYGVSPDTATMAVTEWVEPDAFGAITAANIARVRVMRVGLVVRSAQPEKPDELGNCSASEAQPLLLGESLNVPDVGTTSWRCFRYRQAQVVVPLRNVVMGLR